jgi:hypothetical protein
LHVDLSRNLFSKSDRRCHVVTITQQMVLSSNKAQHHEDTGLYFIDFRNG